MGAFTAGAGLQTPVPPSLAARPNKNTLNEVGHPDKMLWAFRCLCGGFLKKFVCFLDTGPPSIYSQVLFKIFLQAKEVKRKAHRRELHLGRGQTPWKVLSCFPSHSSALDYIGWGWATFTAKVWNLSPNILECVSAKCWL